MARIVNNFTQGDTPTWSIQVFTDTAKTTAFDTTGWKCWVTMKSDKNIIDALAEFQVSSVMGSVDGALGLVSVKPSISETNALPAGTYFYDFQILSNDSTIDTLECGRVKVDQATTIASA